MVCLELSFQYLDLMFSQARPCWRVPHIFIVLLVWSVRHVLVVVRVTIGYVELVELLLRVLNEGRVGIGMVEDLLLRRLRRVGG